VRGICHRTNHSISDEGLLTYRVFNRRYRNRRIGDFLKEMHLTEGWNMGFRKILNALKRNGSPKPIFETDPECLSFYTTIFVHPQFLPSPEGIRPPSKAPEPQGFRAFSFPQTVAFAVWILQRSRAPVSQPCSSYFWSAVGFPFAHPTCPGGRSCVSFYVAQYLFLVYNDCRR